MKAQILAKGYPPSVREICEAVNLRSTSSVHAHLETLEKNGYIRRDASKTRAIEIIDDDFNKVIHKKKIIDSSIKESVDALEITDIDFKEDKKEEEIVLPEIKIKKDNLSDVWE